MPWRSSGWTDDKNVSKMVDHMVACGDVACAGREGRERLWDLAERVYPDDEPVPTKRRCGCATSGGCVRWASPGRRRPRHRTSPTTSATPARTQSSRASAAGGGSTRRSWTRLGSRFRGRAAVLSPLDRLVYDRKRMAELFEFDYQLEMYKPVAKRRWGYWAMPVLYGDRLVGKVDATADRDRGVLRVDAVHRDGEWSKAMTTAVDREIGGLASWLGLEVRHGPG